MGPLGWQEAIVVFILALLIFGPRKLPELGKTVGKAMSEFRRASNELKTTWSREMQAIERETSSIREETRKIGNEIASSYNDIDYGPNRDYESDYGYEDTYNYGASEQKTPSDSGSTEESTTVGASATQGAESTASESSEGSENNAPQGTVPTSADGVADGDKTGKSSDSEPVAT